jgi:hypothetical protein
MQKNLVLFYWFNKNYVKKLPLFFKDFVGVTVFQKGTETHVSE